MYLFTARHIKSPKPYLHDSAAGFSSLISLHDLWIGRINHWASKSFRCIKSKIRLYHFSGPEWKKAQESFRSAEKKVRPKRTPHRAAGRMSFGAFYSNELNLRPGRKPACPMLTTQSKKASQRHRKSDTARLQRLYSKLFREPLHYASKKSTFRKKRKITPIYNERMRCVNWRRRARWVWLLLSFVTFATKLT